MTKKTNCASKASIEDFRDQVAQSLGLASGVLINLIDVLAIGPRPISPAEMTLSPLWGYRWSNLYTGIDRASQELAETIADQDWLQELRKQRLAWLASQVTYRIEAAHEFGGSSRIAELLDLSRRSCARRPASSRKTRYRQSPRAQLFLIREKRSRPRPILLRPR